MTTTSHMVALQRRHEELERQIEEEMQHPAFDDLVVASLKRQKLEVKDELFKLETEQAAG